jgi:dienelactone hydrolase
MNRYKESSRSTAPRRVLACLVALTVLGSDCARTLFGRGEPFQPWATPALGVTVEQKDDTLVVRPAPGDATPRVLLFLHGFASTPDQYRYTLEHLAARGFVVWAPTLPDYFVGRIGYHRSVLKAARASYDAAATEAKRLGAPPPVVAGFSMGGGAALLVAAEQGVPTVLWAPVPLDLPLPVPTAPLLVLAGDHDCIAKERPRELLAALAGRAEGVVISGNHLGFTDLTGGEQYDCPSPVSRNAQREDAVDRTVRFFERHGR